MYMFVDESAEITIAIFHPFRNDSVPNEGGWSNCGRVSTKIAHSSLLISVVTGPKFSKFF